MALKEGDKVKVLKGQNKDMKGTITDIIGDYAYVILPDRAPKGKNTETTEKLTNLITIEESKNMKVKLTLTEQKKVKAFAKRLVETRTINEGRVDQIRLQEMLDKLNDVAEEILDEADLQMDAKLETAFRKVGDYLNNSISILEKLEDNLPAEHFSDEE